MASSAPEPGDALWPELLRLLRTALHVIDQHVNREGCCAACASPRPCRQAEPAEFAPGAL